MRWCEIVVVDRAGRLGDTRMEFDNSSYEAAMTDDMSYTIVVLTASHPDR